MTKRDSICLNSTWNFSPLWTIYNAIIYSTNWNLDMRSNKISSKPSNVFALERIFQVPRALLVFLEWLHPFCPLKSSKSVLQQSMNFIPLKSLLSSPSVINILAVLHFMSGKRYMNMKSSI